MVFNEYVLAGYLLWHPLLFPATIVLVENVLFTLLLWFNSLQLFAITMPLFRNGINHLDFQKKSERPKY